MSVWMILNDQYEYDSFGWVQALKYYLKTKSDMTRVYSTGWRKRFNHMIDENFLSSDKSDLIFQNLKYQ